MTVPMRRDDQAPRSLSDIFNQFAKESVDRFSSLDGRLLILDSNEKASYGRESLDLKRAGYADTAIDTFLKKRLAAKSRQTYAEWNNSLNLFFILYDEPVNQNERQAVSKNTEKDILFILDHELAHLVIKDPALEGENNQYKSSIKEAIADAYAMIRHYQRYGTDSSHQNSIIDPWARAGALSLNKDTIHFSTFMLDEIIKRKDIIDFSSLSPQQTIELARRFATEYTPASSVVNRTFKKLKPVQEAFEQDSASGEWLKILAQITLDPRNDSYTFRVCKKVLNGYLDGRTDMEGVSVDTSGEHWDNVRKSLKEAEFRYAQEDILFNIPLIKEKPKKTKARKPSSPPQ